MLPDQLCCENSVPLQNVGLYKMAYVYICELGQTILELVVYIHISLYKIALLYLIIFLQYGRVLSTEIPVYNFQGCLRWFTKKW